MSTNTAIFWPIFVQVALIFTLYALLSRRRMVAVRQGRATVAQFRENRDEPAESLFVRNSLGNQFELPILFYVCCILLFITDADNLPTVLLAWVFVLSRCVHAYVHVTSNRIRYRQPAFVAGFIALVLMWLWLAIWMVMS